MAEKEKGKDVLGYVTVPPQEEPAPTAERDS